MKMSVSCSVYIVRERKRKVSRGLSVHVHHDLD